jgi:hypothetical protein
MYYCFLFLSNSHTNNHQMDNAAIGQAAAVEALKMSAQQNQNKPLPPSPSHPPAQGASPGSPQDKLVRHIVLQFVLAEMSDKYCRSHSRWHKLGSCLIRNMVQAGGVNMMKRKFKVRTTFLLSSWYDDYISSISICVNLFSPPPPSICISNALPFLSRPSVHT